VPVQLRKVFVGHQVRSVNDRSLGWKNITNGRLLAEMEGRFDLLVTADRNLYAQQNLSGRKLSILVLPTNRRWDVLALAERLTEIVDATTFGQYLMLHASGEVRARSFRFGSNEDGDKD
jgi:hypothetical protein